MISSRPRLPFIEDDRKKSPRQSRVSTAEFMQMHRLDVTFPETSFNVKKNSYKKRLKISRRRRVTSVSKKCETI